MAQFVLVHGSFHGGWCWKKVVPTLREAGHEVYTPTMTGLGERHHLVSPHVGLHVNVDDIVQVLDYEDLTDVILVGHSYGSLVVTGVAERRPDRLRRLVHLDGYLPEDGQSAWDLTPEAGELWQELADENGHGWLVPPPDVTESYGITDPEDVEWLEERLVPTTLLTHEEPLEAPEGNAKELPRTFIWCSEYETFSHMATKAREEGLDYHEIETGHDAMVSAPEELAHILLGKADKPTR